MNIIYLRTLGHLVDIDVKYLQRIICLYVLWKKNYFSLYAELGNNML